MLINYLVGLLISLQVGTICKQGEPVDWAHWTKTHPYAETVAEARFDGEFEFWLIDGDGRAKQPSDKDGLVLFVFNMDSYPHGQCARQLDVWQMHY